MKKKIADSLYKLYDGDFSHFPKRVCILLWDKFKPDHRFYPWHIVTTHPITSPTGKSFKLKLQK